MRGDLVIGVVGKLEIDFGFDLGKGGESFDVVRHRNWVGLRFPMAKIFLTRAGGKDGKSQKRPEAVPSAITVLN